MAWYDGLAGFGEDLLGVGGVANPQTAAQGSAQNPNQAYLTQQSFGASQAAQGNANADRAQAGQINAGQNALGADLVGSEGTFRNTINNVSAPSVAQQQLNIQNQQNSRKALGGAAGVGGANAFAARRQAMNSIADQNTGTNQSAGLLRATEVQNAQQNLLNAQQARGTVLANQAGATGNALGVDTGAGVQYQNNAMSGAQKTQQQQIDARNQQKKDRGFLGGQIGSTIAGALGL